MIIEKKIFVGYAQIAILKLILLLEKIKLKKAVKEHEHS